MIIIKSENEKVSPSNSRKWQLWLCTCDNLAVVITCGFNDRASLPALEAVVRCDTEVDAPRCSEVLDINAPDCSPELDSV